eukprot:2022402-Pyramimonas_sp.AAC.1
MRRGRSASFGKTVGSSGAVDLWRFSRGPPPPQIVDSDAGNSSGGPSPGGPQGGVCALAVVGAGMLPVSRKRGDAE